MCGQAGSPPGLPRAAGWHCSPPRSAMAPGPAPLPPAGNPDRKQPPLRTRARSNKRGGIFKAGTPLLKLALKFLSAEETGFEPSLAGSPAGSVRVGKGGADEAERATDA